MEVEKIFAERLKELRHENNLSMKKLAEKIGVSDAAIARWENCERSINLHNLVAIAKYFNVTTDYLCGLED